MAIGETLLKFTDYPFAYAIVLLLTKVRDIDPLSHDATPYLLGAGIAASVLVITDPFGRILKGWLMLSEKLYFKKNQNKEKILKSWDDIKGTFHTQPIEIEKDKVVGTIYFLLLLAFVMYLVNDDTVFKSYLNFFDQNDPLCDSNCLQSKTYWTLFAISIIVAGVGGWNGAQIFKKLRTMATYLYCKNSPFVFQSSIQSISDFIKLGDWKTAESWKDKITTEYLAEEGLQKDRDENLRKHTQVLLTQFINHKKSIDERNFGLLADPKSLNDASRHYQTVGDIFMKFPLYKNLITHLYTTTNSEIYDLFLKYVNIRNKLQEGNKEWQKQKNQYIENIVNGLTMRVTEKTTGGMRGENDQWINIAKIKMELDEFVITDRTTLIPIKNNPNSPLWKVKFFDSSSLVQPRDDTVAELYKSDAEYLSAELAHIAVSLRESVEYSRTDIEEEHSVTTQLRTKLDELSLSISLVGDPMRGSCTICRNSRFFPQSEIESHTKKLQDLPLSILKLDKQEL